MTDEFVQAAMPRYGRVPRGLLRDPGISHLAVRLYGLLDDYAGAETRPFPKRATLAVACGCSTDTVDRGLKELVACDWLRKIERRRADGGNTSNLYVLGAGPLNQGEGGRMDAAPPAALVRPQEGTPDEGLTPLPPDEDTLPISVAAVGGMRDNGNMSTPPATVSRPRKRREAVDGDPSWEAFWSAYPRKVAKGAARKAFPKALDKAGSSELILDAVARYAAEVRGKDMDKVAHPATWLNAERWSDQSTVKEQAGATRRPPKKAEECSAHVGEYADTCRACAADRKAARQE